MEHQPEKQHTSNDKNQPKPGKKNKCCPHTKAKGSRGNRGFLEGCLFALCCCWVCDICFDTTVVIG